jgi:hypothetical protein
MVKFWFLENPKQMERPRLVRYSCYEKKSKSINLKRGQIAKGRIIQQQALNVVLVCA